MQARNNGESSYKDTVHESRQSENIKTRYTEEGGSGLILDTWLTQGPDNGTSIKKNKNDVKRRNTIGCLDEYTSKMVRLWKSWDRETV